MLNGSIHMQMFCGVLLDPSQPIKNGKIVSAIRNRLAPILSFDGGTLLLPEFLGGCGSSYFDRRSRKSAFSFFKALLERPEHAGTAWES